MATTSPDNLWSPDSGDDYNLTIDWAASLQTVQDALNRKDTRGRLLSVVDVPWDSTMGPSFAPGADGAVNWPEGARNVATLNLPDPGVPYRVQMFAQGYWGSELDNGTRFDFDMVCDTTTFATRRPANDELWFNNFRSWSPPPSIATFTGGKTLYFRARRIGASSGFGAVRKSESRVTAVIYSA